jgi:exonuclease III
MECADSAPNRKDARKRRTNYANRVTDCRPTRNKMERTRSKKKDKYDLHYSCNKRKTGQLGTGFLVKKEIVKHILGFETINERISKLRLKVKYRNIKIINLYAPTEEKMRKQKNASTHSCSKYRRKYQNMI